MGDDTVEALSACRKDRPMTVPSERDIWQRRAAALRLVYTDFALLHGMVMDEIGHPLPPDMGDFVRDWLDTAARAVEKNVTGLP
jgi:hypothetical protein